LNITFKTEASIQFFRSLFNRANKASKINGL